MENIIPCMEVFPYIFSYMENTGSIKFEYITFDLDVCIFLLTWKYIFHTSIYGKYNLCMEMYFLYISLYGKYISMYGKYISM